MSDSSTQSRRSGSGGPRRSGNSRRRSNNNRNRNRNRNRSGGDGDGGGGGDGQQGRRQGPGRRREHKPVPLTWWQKLLKSVGLYKEPVRPPRKRKGASDSTDDDSGGPKRTPKSGTRVAKTSSPRTAPRPKPVDSTRLYLGNLSYDAAEHDLENLFKGVGAVRNVEIVYNRNTHKSKGYGFIEMATLEEAKRAVEVLHDQPFMGRKMIVSGAKSQGPADGDYDNEDDDPRDSDEEAA